MTTRHLSNDERQTLASIMKACGPAEVIRVVASLTANLLDYSEVGNAARSDLLRIAVRVDPNLNGKEPAVAPATCNPNAIEQKASPDEGWAHPLNERKHHYYRGGRSLCGRKGFFGKVQHRSKGILCSTDECHACWKKAPETDEERALNRVFREGGLREDLVAPEVVSTLLRKGLIERFRSRRIDKVRATRAGADIVTARHNNV